MTPQQQPYAAGMLALRVYHVLLYLYPARFRQKYGREMRLVFRDLCRDAYDHSGHRGVLMVLLRTLVDTLKNSAGEWAAILLAHWGKVLVFGLGLILMGIVSFTIFIWMDFVSHAILVPWDTAIIKPPAGDAALIINDLFDDPPFSLVIPLAVTSANFMLFMRAARRGPLTAFLPWKFALAGVLFLAGSYICLAIGTKINNLLLPFPVGRSDYGYHRSVIIALMSGLSIFVYFRVLSQFGRADFASRVVAVAP